MHIQTPLTSPSSLAELLFPVFNPHSSKEQTHPTSEGTLTMWHLSWPKTTCSTKIGGHEPQTTTATATAATKCIKASPSPCHCTCLAKLVRKLRKQRRRAGCAKSSSFQCRYDPLSYSLNFDASGCGNLSDDQDYYKFYAFSSRFVANPSGASCPRLITTTTH